MEESRGSEIDGTRDGSVNPADLGAASPSAVPDEEHSGDEEPDEPLDYESGHWETLADASGFYKDAVRRGDAAAVDYWFAASADEKRRRLLGFWNGTFYDGPLHVAAERGHTDVIRVLLRWADSCGVKGEAVESVDGQGRTPLLCAVASASEEVAAALLNGGANTERRLKLSRPAPGAAWQVGTVLHMAVGRSIGPLTRLLLKHGARTKARDAPDGNTPLHLARTADIARLLLRAGARGNARNRSGETPDAVAEDRHKRIAGLRAMVGEGEDAKTVVALHDGPLYARAGSEDVARAVMDARAVLDLLRAQGTEGVSVYLRLYTNRSRQWCVDAAEGFLRALSSGDGGQVRRWLNDVDLARERTGDLRFGLSLWRRWDNLSALQAAASDGRTEVVLTLLNFGWDVDERRPWCIRTPLFLAVEAGHTQTAALLLERGADPNRRQPRADQREEDRRLPITTALHEAARRGDGPMVRLLLNHGANPDARDWRGDTALHTTRWVAFDADIGPSGVVDALVAAGASLKAVNAVGQIPLAWACSPEARLTEQIMADQIVGQTLGQALIRHHLIQSAQAVADALRCLEVLKASDPEVEWRIGIMLRDVRTKSEDGHKAGHVVLMRPCNNTDWDNLMVVRPKPSDGLLGAAAGAVADLSDCYDNMVLGVRGSAVVQVESLVQSFEGDAQIRY